MDAPYLPTSLINYLALDSQRLGVKSDLPLLSELHKHKKQQPTPNRQKADVDTNAAILPGNTSTMMLNTNRNENLETQRHLPQQQLGNAARARRRNSDLLDNTLEMLNHNLQDIPLDDSDQRPQRRNNTIITENESEDQPNRGRQTQLHTDLGIISQAPLTNGTPVNNSTAGDRSLSITRRNEDGTSSRISMSNPHEVMVSIIFSKTLIFETKSNFNSYFVLEQKETSKG